MRARLRQSYLNQSRVIDCLKLALLICVLVILPLYRPSPAGALELSNRSVQLGSAIPSAVDSYNFSFSVPSITNLGSIAFLFCSNSPLLSESCTPPAGLDASAAALASQSGNVGFSIDGAHSNSNTLVITRLAAPAIPTTTNYLFNNITNPSAAGTTTFVRISTYQTTDASGPYTDNGSVAYVTASRFSIGAYVPPFLEMCVGLSVAPNCTSLSGDSLNLNQLSASSANAGVSQFSAGTNSPSGYAVYGLGTTMTSGNNFIPSLPSATPSSPGTGQFGINLRANLLPPVGNDPVGTGIATPTANYNQPNRFTYNSGDMLAQAPQPSDYNRMTVSYLVNIPSSQAPGVYSTTITYQAVAQF